MVLSSPQGRTMSIYQIFYEERATLNRTMLVSIKDTRFSPLNILYGVHSCGDHTTQYMVSMCIGRHSTQCVPGMISVWSCLLKVAFPVSLRTCSGTSQQFSLGHHESALLRI